MMSYLEEVNRHDSPSPPVSVAGYSNHDLFMVRCQQHITRIVAASQGGDTALPMLTRIGSTQVGDAVRVAEAAVAAARSGNERIRKQDVLSDDVESSDEEGRCEKRAKHCDWGAGELQLAYDLQTIWDADFWQAQTDLSSKLGELADGL